MSQPEFNFELPAAKVPLPFGVVDADTGPSVEYKGDPDVVRAYWWATRGGLDGDWWRALPSYERHNWVTHYKAEVALAGPGKPIRTARQVHDMVSGGFEETKAMAERWAKEIEEAWKQRKPCPIIPEPAYRWVLDWAFRIAKVPTPA
jgi:hypothetical protein